MAKKRKRVVKRKRSSVSSKGKRPRSASGKSKNSKVKKLIRLAKLRTKLKGRKKSLKKKRK